MDAKSLEKFDSDYYRTNLFAGLCGGVFFAGRLMESFSRNGSPTSKTGIVMQIICLLLIIFLAIRLRILMAAAKTEPELYNAIVNNEQRRHYNLLSYKWALFTMIGSAVCLAFADKWIGMPVATFAWIIIFVGILAGATAWLIYNRR